ncbi:MAG TPA: hypothetical protein VIG47_08365 [Gemmatimonadaceae bacterium]|jgi:hypothetical protein
MNEPRYDDKEVAEIFRSASEGLRLPQQQSASEPGLTLADLQSIGGQAGIPSDAIARAALALDVQRGSPRRTFLGLPIGVSRTVDLKRRLTDEEWERVVVQLRGVFDAQGTTRSDGSLRQWSNGNLRVLLEPTENGQRLRLRTFNGSARNSIVIGLAAFVVTIAATLAAAADGSLAHAMYGNGFMAVLELGLIANGALRLPKWARLRGRQMEEIAVSLVLPPGSSGEPAALPPQA